MSSIPHPELVADILAHCEAAGISRAEFGIKALNDPRFVYDLQAGRECRQATIAKARAFMAGAGEASKARTA